MPIIPNPPIPGMLRARIAGTDGAGNVWNNLEYFSYSGPAPSLADVAAYADGIYIQWLGAFIANLPPPLTFESVTVTDLSSLTGQEAEHALTNVGQSTADKVPANCAVVISKVIDARYRGGRPRTYSIVLADENLQDPANINDAYVATMATNYGNFITGCLALSSGATAINGHKSVAYFGHFGPVGAPEYFPGTKKLLVPLVFPIQSFTVDKQLGSQRGRIGRRR